MGKRSRKPASIQYVGIAGISKDCQDAVLRLLQYGDEVTRVRILSSSRHHCLLLTVGVGETVAVKSGFASGYGGEGPRTFSYVLQVLRAHGVEIDEYDVPPEMIERLDSSALTQSDLDTLDDTDPVRPTRWYDYILDHDFDRTRGGPNWREFPLIIPFAVIDERIADLAVSFWSDPDGKLLTGYRRLEDAVRKRTRINEHGAKLFSEVFNPRDGKLTWKNVDEGERAGRMNLFTGTFTSYRNRRAHRESRHTQEKLLLEFLLLNHLYRLESECSNVRRRKRRSVP